MNTHDLRSALFNTLFRQMIEVCRDHFLHDEKILGNIIKVLYTETLRLGCRNDDLLAALSPELGDWLHKELPALEKSRRHRKFDRLTTGEQRGLAFRYLLYYFTASTPAGLRELREVDLYAPFDHVACSKVCREKGLQQEVSKYVLNLAMDLCLTPSQRSRVRKKAKEIMKKPRRKVRKDSGR